MPENEGPSDHADDSPQPRTVLPYATPAMPSKMTTIRRMSSFEANLAAAKLEAAGVRAFVADENMATAHPLVVPAVRLQVPEDDVDRAEQILGTWPPVQTEADDRLDGDYVEEAYRCPNCHRKAVDLLPLPAGLRAARFGCLAMLVVPGLMMILLRSGFGSPPPVVTLTWLGVLAVLTYTLLTAKRTKQCRDCGHVWGDGSVES